MPAVLTSNRTRDVDPNLPFENSQSGHSIQEFWSVGKRLRLVLKVKNENIWEVRV